MEGPTDKIRVYIGYSGLRAGQWITELENKSWLTEAGSRKLIFHSKYEEIGKDSQKKSGGDYEMMINFPIDPQLN